jgi:hypothetical protein
LSTVTTAASIQAFFELFDTHGFFWTLTEYARKARYPVDLQFRRNPKTAAQHASLYVGLTTVLDVHWKPGAVRLAAHPTFHPSGFQAAWMSWTAIGDAGARADAVDAYLDAVIPKAAAGRDGRRLLPGLGLRPVRWAALAQCGPSPGRWDVSAVRSQLGRPGCLLWLSLPVAAA